MEINNVASLEIPAKHLADEINQKLAENKAVLWLVCGGSSIKLAVATSLLINESKNLTITLTDERFGPSGHKNSNWQQLKDQGFLTKSAKVFEMLSDQTDINKTVEDFRDRLTEATKQADFVIGLFGVGSDGHIAGILPHSAAFNEDPVSVVSYQASDFTRITISPLYFNTINFAAIYFEDDSKTPFIKRLDQEISANEEPVQLIKRTGAFVVYHKQ